MRDFTLKSYAALMTSLQAAGYCFQTFEEFVITPKEERVIVMRHDVDEKPNNALKMAVLEHELGIRSTYFFRIVKKSNVPEVIEKIAELGHEIGYHYEDLASAEGDEVKAIASFEKNLAYFRQYYPVRSICMHGSSSSKYDNRLLWKDRSFSDYGLIGEPYLSVDFDKVYYLSDTGYAWDGGKFAVRDIVENHFVLSFHSTQQIVDCIRKDAFPPIAMILAHTLWTDSIIQWCWLHLRELLRNETKKWAKNNQFVGNVYKKMVDFYWK